MRNSSAPRPSWVTLARLARQLRPLRWQLLAAELAVVATTALQLRYSSAAGPSDYRAGGCRWRAAHARRRYHLSPGDQLAARSPLAALFAADRLVDYGCGPVAETLSITGAARGGGSPGPRHGA